jgi:hypothetical protein
MDQYSVNILVDNLSQGMGIEGAKNVVKEAMNKVGINQTTCNRDQFVKLCQTLKEKKGYAATIASITLTKLYSGKLDNELGVKK